MIFHQRSSRPDKCDVPLKVVQSDLIISTALIYPWLCTKLCYAMLHKLKGLVFQINQGFPFFRFANECRIALLIKASSSDFLHI